VKRVLLACIVVACLSGFQDQNSRTLQELVAVEKASMDGWQKGDSGPALAVSAPDITMFHVMTRQRLEGRSAVQALYAGYSGRPLFDSYRIDAPKVQASGEMAVLTYVLVTRNAENAQKWNATQVYQRSKGVWALIHSHFSQIQQ
jgi:hypothetical protein